MQVARRRVVVKKGWEGGGMREGIRRWVLQEKMREREGRVRDMGKR